MISNRVHQQQRLSMPRHYLPRRIPYNIIEIMSPTSHRKPSYRVFHAIDEAFWKYFT